MYETKVGSVHFDKNLGLAKITRETAEEFCRRHHPDQYDEFCERTRTAAYPIFLDLEHLLTAMESMPPYQVLLDVVRRQRVITLEEKAFLACFVYLQLLRSHAIMNAALEWQREIGIPKFEYFVMLQARLSDPDALMRAVGPLALSRWHLHYAHEDVLPLTDSPILVRSKSIWVALSPRLLLEIDLTNPTAEQDWQVSTEAISEARLLEFRQRTIGNTFREIIFGNRNTLEAWRETSDFRTRVALMRDRKRYNTMVRAEHDGELWLFNAYGNR